MIRRIISFGPEIMILTVLEFLFLYLAEDQQPSLTNPHYVQDCLIFLLAYVVLRALYFRFRHLW